MTVASAPQFLAAHSNLTYNGTSTAAAAAPVNSSQTARFLRQILDGPQTPKATQPELDLWIPLMFWCNRDPRLAVASVAIPYGQRYITVDIEAQSNILFTAPGNLWLRLTTEQFTSTGAGKGTAAGLVVVDMKRTVTLQPTLASGSTINSAQQIKNMDLYINNIFVNSEIHDIYIKRIGFSLIRVHRFQQANISSTTPEILLSNMKWPIEYMFVGARPQDNLLSSNTNQYRDWHRFTAMTDNIVVVPSKSTHKVVIDNTAAIDSASKQFTAASYETTERVVYPTPVQVVDQMSVRAHGITLVDSYKRLFFSDYVPYTFGGLNINTPEDEGCMMINFCLYPGTYQPSGHMNISRAREFYLLLQASYFGSGAAGDGKKADLIVLASAINFLLVSDGSAILRYST